MVGAAQAGTLEFHVLLVFAHASVSCRAGRGKSGAYEVAG